MSLAFGDGRLTLRILGELFEGLTGRFAGTSAERGALFLIWGGLVVIVFLVLASLFQSAVSPVRAIDDGSRGTRPRVATELPPEAPPLEAPAWGRDVPSKPQEEHARGHVAGRFARARTLDDVLDRVREARLGEARLLRSTPRSKLVRVYGCAGCKRAWGRAVCDFERGFLQGAFERMLAAPVRVEEVRCRAEGGAMPGCEFELRY